MTKEIGQESSCGASIFALHFDFKLSDLTRSKTMKRADLLHRDQRGLPFWEGIDVVSHWQEYTVNKT